jgi:hypothetical protein
VPSFASIHQIGLCKQLLGVFSQQCLEVLIFRCLEVGIDAEKLKADGLIFLLQCVVLVCPQIEGETDALDIGGNVFASHEQASVVLKVLDPDQAAYFLIGKQVGVSFIHKHACMVSNESHVCKPSMHPGVHSYDLQQIFAVSYHITLLYFRKICRNRLNFLYHCWIIGRVCPEGRGFLFDCTSRRYPVSLCTQ